MRKKWKLQRSKISKTAVIRTNYSYAASSSFNPQLKFHLYILAYPSMLFSSMFIRWCQQGLRGGTSELPSPVGLKSNIALVSHTRASAAVAVLLGLQQIKLAHPLLSTDPTHKLRVPSETRADQTSQKRGRAVVWPGRSHCATGCCPKIQ